MTGKENAKNKFLCRTSQTIRTCLSCQTFANGELIFRSWVSFLDLDHLVGHNVGANLMFALEQMSPANECSRANTRFALQCGHVNDPIWPKP